MTLISSAKPKRYILRIIAVLSLCFLIALSLAYTPRASAGKEASVCSPESLKSSLLEMSQGLRQGLGFEDSVKELAQCVEESSPDLTEFDSGMVAFARHKYEDAVRLLSMGLKGLKNQDDSSFAYLMLGGAYAGWGIFLGSLGDENNAFSKFRSALAALDPGNLFNGFPSFWDSRAKLQDALGFSKEATISRDSARALRPLFWEALAAHHEKDNEHSSALVCYDSALAYSPKDASLWRPRGYVLGRLKRYDEALISIDSALAYNREDWRTWFGKGWIFLQKNEYASSLSCFDSALVRDPSNSEVWLNRAWALDRLGRFEEALPYYDSALARAPNSHNVWYTRGQTLANLNRWGEALTSYDSAITYKPDLAGAWSKRGVALCKLNRFSEALGSLDSALVIDPEDSSAWANKSVTLFLMSRYEESLKACEMALRYSPGHKLYLDLRQQILNKLGRK
jgi:tetratricopeptide (TPR) repeat protein